MFLLELSLHFVHVFDVPIAALSPPVERLLIDNAVRWEPCGLSLDCRLNQCKGMLHTSGTGAGLELYPYSIMKSKSGYEIRLHLLTQVAA